jgi:hypothetical protein
VRSNRDATDLLQALGGDSQFTTLEIAEYIQPIINVDLLASQSLPNRTRIVVHYSPVPSTLAGDASAFTITPAFPCYLTRFVSPNNASIRISGAGAYSVLSATDGGQIQGIVSLFDAPPGPFVQSFSGILSGLGKDGPGATGQPQLFDQTKQGRITAGLGAGSHFLAGTQELLLPGQSLYLGAHMQLCSATSALNLATSWHLRFEFCVQAIRASDAAGNPLTM